MNQEAFTQGFLATGATSSDIGLKTKMTKSSSCTSHDPNTPKSFDNRQKPIQLKRLRGLTDKQTKAWAERTWALSREGKSGQKALFTREKKAQILGFMKAAALGDNINNTISGFAPRLTSMDEALAGVAGQVGKLTNSTDKLESQLAELLGLGKQTASTLGGAGGYAGNNLM